MRPIAEFISVLACVLFTGAAIYISFVEHPARMQCGVELAATEFVPSYRRATVMQATSAAVGLLSSLAAWLAGATVWWLLAGLLLGSVIPFTLPCSSFFFPHERKHRLEFLLRGGLRQLLGVVEFRQDVASNENFPGPQELVQSFGEVVNRAVVEIGLVVSQELHLAKKLLALDLIQVAQVVLCREAAEESESELYARSVFSLLPC